MEGSATQENLANQFTSFVEKGFNDPLSLRNNQPKVFPDDLAYINRWQWQRTPSKFEDVNDHRVDRVYFGFINPTPQYKGGFSRIASFEFHLSSGSSFIKIIKNPESYPVYRSDDKHNSDREELFIRRIPYKGKYYGSIHPHDDFTGVFEQRRLEFTRKRNGEFDELRLSFDGGSLQKRPTGVLINIGRDGIPVSEIIEQKRVVKPSGTAVFVIEFDPDNQEITIERTIEKEGETIKADIITFPINIPDYQGAEYRIFTKKTSLLEDPYEANLSEDHQWLHADLQSAIGLGWIHDPEEPFKFTDDTSSIQEL